MAKRAKKLTTQPYHLVPGITVHYEHGDIKPGDTFKVSGVRGSFVFHKRVVNSIKSVEWVDCMDTKTGEFRSFYIDRVRVKPQKRQRRKRWQIEQAKVVEALPPLVTQSNRVGTCSKCKCELTLETAAPSIVKRMSGYCKSCMKAYVQSRSAK
jgi:hypothetical protein